MKENIRIIYFDLMKVIAIYFVIFYHCNFLSTNLLDMPTPITYFYYFNKTILSCCVPLFFFVNGALILNKSFDLKKHIKKILSIIVVTYIWSIITIEGISLLKQPPLSVLEFFEIFISQQIGWINHLWFLNALVVLYLFFPIIKYVYDYEKSYYYFFVIIISFFTFGTKLVVSAKYCYATHELRLHQNDRCKRFTLV